jgi:3-phenylpropionate/trans-cinnamate dioxygenase ferredoxin reductase subunit
MVARAGIVIVGAGLAGTRAAESLRREGVEEPITMIGAESHLPYDRPPLSKEVFRGERSESPLRDKWDDLRVDMRTGRRVMSVAADRGVVVLDDGDELAYGALLLTTGAEPRRLPGVSGAGAHVLRTVDQSRRLVRDVTRAGRLTIIGGGLIGCEVAASARQLGVEVALIEALPGPMARILGTEVAAEVARQHERAGVALACGVSVVEARGEGDDRELVLSDGRMVSAPVMLVSLGVRPDTDWLDDSGIAVDDGILCDASGRTSVPGIWAAGDVARWSHPLYGRTIRIEHWTNAVEQGQTVGQAIAGVDAVHAEVPYFWSDQYGIKYQMMGLPEPDDEVEILHVGAEADRLLAVYGREGMLTGVFGASAPRWVMRLRSLLMKGGTFEEGLTAARA